MRPSEFEAIRPTLERAIDDINAYFEKKRQSREFVKELEREFNRQATVPEGTASKTDLKTIPRKQYKQVVRSMLGPPPKQKGAMQQYRIREKLLMRHPPITRRLIELDYPWRHSAAQAANDLWDCGWTKEAEKIARVLSDLPTGPVDGNQPEILKHQLDAIRAAAERVKKILEASLGEQPPAATPSDAAVSQTDPAATPVDAENSKSDGQAATTKKTEVKSTGWLSPADLAKKHGVNQDNLRKRLATWRKKHDGGWMMVSPNERRVNEPKFLYREDAVSGVIKE